MRDPRKDPQTGDRVVKIVTDRNGVTRVTSRLVLGCSFGCVSYTPKKTMHSCTLAHWRKWAKGARLPKL
jgi:hypothetical protein